MLLPIPGARTEETGVTDVKETELVEVAADSGSW